MRRLATAAAALWVGLWVAMVLAYPYCTDHGIYAWVADAILAGGRPYADAWEVKGPVTHVIVALARGIFGDGQWGLRLVDLAILAAGLWAVHRVVRRVAEPMAAWMAAVVALLLYARGSAYHTAQPDGWAAVLVAVVVLLALAPPERRGPSPSALVGVLAAMACLIKPTYALVLLPAAAGMGLGRGRRGAGAAWAAILGGGLVSTAVVLGWLASGGALRPFLETWLLFNPSAHAGGRWAPDRLAEGLATFFLRDPQVVVVGLAAFGLWWAWSLHRRWATVVGATALAAVLAVIAQGWFAVAHWHPVKLVLAVAAGAGVQAALDLLRSQEGGACQRLAWLLGLHVMVAAAVLLAKPSFEMALWARATVTGQPERWLARFGRPGEDAFSAVGSRRVAEAVRLRTTVGDPILVWAINPGLYLLAERPSPSRFGMSYGLTQPSNPLLEAWRQELLEDLRRHPPALVLASTCDGGSVLNRGSSYEQLDIFPALKAWIDAEYDHVTDLAGYRLWQRREP